MERGRGPVATVLVQAGTLRVGDDFVCGHISGRVRALTDDRGERVTEAPPATPVVVSGLDEVPVAGEIFQVVQSEQAARSIALARRSEIRAAESARGAAPRVTLEELARRTREGESKELNLVVKADAQGSLEAVVGSLAKVEAGEVAVKLVGQGVGPVSDSDLLLASVSNAIIVCFNLRPNQASERAAEKQKVEVRYYDVIYKLIEDVERAARGLREPVYREVFNGRIEVVMAIKIPGRSIAGCRILEGRVGRNDVVSLKRGGREIYKGPIDSLKHYKEDVREMREGEECGIGLQGYDEFEPGDLMEAFRLEREEP
jgi:translation initiation factor IF-2